MCGQVASVSPLEGNKSISVAEKLQETARVGGGPHCGRLSLLLCLQYKYSSPPVNQHGDLCDVSVARGAVSSCKQKLYRRTGFKSNKSQVALNLKPNESHCCIREAVGIL